MKNGTLVEHFNQNSALSKNDPRFWESRVVRRSGSLFSVRIGHLKRRDWFNTGETRKYQAALKAREIYFYLRSNGWDKALAKYKQKGEPRMREPTLGEFFEAIRNHSTRNENTLNIYFSKFCTLAAEINGIHKTRNMAYSKGKAYKKWLSQVESIKLSRLTAPRVQLWKKARLGKASTPEEKARTRRTINSILRNAKSLFGQGILDEIRGSGITLPNPLPLSDIQLERVSKIRYRSNVAPRGGIDWLMTSAKNELRPEIPKINPAKLRESKKAIADAKSKHEQFKILILALGGGLRRNEIDTLTWSQVDFTNCTIRVETTAYTDVKTESSEDAVDIHPTVIDFLRNYLSGCKDIFVINSDVEPKLNSSSYHHYRCYRHFRKLTAWLRAKGISDQKPLHALRKEFGSEILRKGGIFMASAQLRHSDIRMTRDAYSYKKQRVTVNLGDALKDNKLTLLEGGING